MGFHALAGIVRDVLGLATTPAPEDNFYALGGDSLSAVRVVSRLAAEHGRTVQLGQFMAAPDLAAIAAASVAARRVRVTAGDAFVPSASQRERLARDAWCRAHGRPVFPQHLMRAVRVRGDLDLDRLADAVRRVARRHDALRWRFADDGTVTVSDVDVVPTVGDLPDCLVTAAERPFDLGQDPLLRVDVYPVGSAEHVLLIVAEHLVTDQWSWGIVLRDLAACYQTGSLPDPVASYADWVRADWADRDSAAFHRSIESWRRALRGGPPVPCVDLPTPHGRPERPTYQGGRVGAEVAAPGLRELAVALRVSRYSLLHAALVAFLWAVCGHDRVDVVTPALNRADPELEQVVGRFANRLVLRTDVAAQQPFRDLVTDIAAADAAALDNAHVPWSAVVERLAPELFGVPQDRPYVFYDVRYGSQDAPFTLAGLDCTTIPLGGIAATPGLAVFFTLRDDEVRAQLSYETDVYPPDDARALLDLLTRFVELAGADPSRSVHDLAGRALLGAPGWLSHHLATI